MGETMRTMQGAAERVMASIGIVLQIDDLTEDIDILQQAIEGTANAELKESMRALGQLATAYAELMQCVPGGILAVEAAQHHAIHWKG